MSRSNTSAEARDNGSAVIDATDVAKSIEMIHEYVKPYQQVFGNTDQGNHFKEMISGLTSDLERKSVEPIAVMHGIERHLLQHFMGTSRWGWDPLQELQRRQVAAEIGTSGGSLIVDGSSTPKKGDNTVGVKRQWCGRHGKVDNCVIGVYAVYVGRDNLASLVGSQIYPDFSFF